MPLDLLRKAIKKHAYPLATPTGEKMYHFCSSSTDRKTFPKQWVAKRLGVNWGIDNKLSITGSNYSAFPHLKSNKKIKTLNS